MWTHPHPETAVLMVVLFATVGTVLFGLIAYTLGLLDQDQRGTAADVALLRGLAHTNRKDMESFDRRIHALELREAAQERKRREWETAWESEIRAAFDRLRVEEAPQRDPVVIDLDPVPVPNLFVKPQHEPTRPTFPVETKPLDLSGAILQRMGIRLDGPERPAFGWLDSGPPTPQTTPPQTDPHALYDDAWADGQELDAPE